jgi:hypothetical protein
VSLRPGASHLQNCCSAVIFHEARMPPPASRRLAIEIAFDKSTDFSLGVRQRHDVGTSIQLTLCIPADDLVLPKRKSFGVGLIYSGNANIGAFQWIKKLIWPRLPGSNVSSTFAPMPIRRRSSPSSRLLYFSPANSMP